MGAKELEESLKLVEDLLAESRKELVEFREAEEKAQAELQSVESRCSVEELRVVRRQLRDLEKLRARPSAPSADSPLFEQEIKVLRQSHDHLVQKCGVEDPDSLEPIESAEEEPTDEEETIQDTEVAEDEVLPVTPSTSRHASHFSRVLLL